MTPEDIREKVHDLPLELTYGLRCRTRSARRKLVIPNMADDFSGDLESDFIDMRRLWHDQAAQDTIIFKEET